MRCSLRNLILLPAAAGWLALAIPSPLLAEDAGAPPRTLEEKSSAEKKANAVKALESGRNDEDKPQSPSDSKAETKKAPAKKLGETAAALRDRVRRTEAQFFQQPVNTNDNTAAEVLKFCLAYGVDAEIRYGSTAGNAINGIGCLCYGYPCAGYQLLILGEKGEIVPRVGYGLQEHPSELLAVLAQSAVPANYEIRVGKHRGSVTELVEFEKNTCRSGTDLTHKLIGLSFYIRNGETWKNEIGEQWSVERLLQEEMNRSPAADRCDVAHHLMSVSWAIERRIRAGKPLDGQFGRAVDYVGKYHDFALSLVNSDGTWNPAFFARKGTSSDISGSLRSTGHILEWLVFSLPQDRLTEARVVRSVNYLADVLSGSYAQWNAAASTPREVDSVAHALHALRIYDQRVFRPYDPPESDGPEKQGAGEPRTSRSGKPTITPR